MLLYDSPISPHKIKESCRCSVSTNTFFGAKVLNKKINFRLKVVFFLHSQYHTLFLKKCRLFGEGRIAFNVYNNFVFLSGQI